jgi:hypothetical protein
MLGNSYIFKINQPRKNETKKIETIKKISCSVLENSTIHGLSNIIRNDSFLIRLMWILCFVLFSSSCAYMMLNTIQEYIRYEVVSRVDVKYENEIVFPMVTICRANPFATDFSTLTLTRNLERNGFNISEYNFDGSLSTLKLKFIGKKNNALLSAANTPENERRKFGPHLNELIISCLFNLYECDLDNDFEDYYDYYFGYCFRFNARKLIGNIRRPIKYSSQAGQINGLQLELFIGAANENNRFFSIESGLAIFIHNQTDIPYNLQGIKISTGTSTYISLDKTTITQIPYPFSDCKEDLTKKSSYNSDLYNKMIATNKTYLQTNCKFMCYQKYLGEQCDCQLYVYKYFLNMQPCLTLNQTNCQSEKRTYFLKNNFFSKCDCPLECEKTLYDYRFSFSEYPTKYYANLLIKHPSIMSRFPNQSQIKYQDLKSRMASVNIYYDELKETFITQEKKLMFHDLVSNLGGTLGLFLGL